MQLPSLRHSGLEWLHYAQCIAARCPRHEAEAKMKEFESWGGSLDAALQRDEVEEEEKEGQKIRIPICGSKNCLGPPWLPRPCWTGVGFTVDCAAAPAPRGYLPLWRARSQPNVFQRGRQRLEQVKANLSRLICELCDHLLRYPAAPAPRDYLPF